MKLSALASQYVAHKQAMGMRFHTEARTLKSFCRAMGDIALVDIAADRVHAYIAGTGPVTPFWHRKYGVLRGFYRFAMARGYAASAPLPKIIPKPPQFVPYIFSHEELQRLLDASDCCESPRSKLQPYTCRMLILLLYGAGLRISEALSLTLATVDLPAGILTIHKSKFYKSRLVPMSPDLTTALETYVTQRAREHSTESDAALFLTRTAIPLERRTAEHIFSRLRVRAGVLRHDGGRYQPRLHDLRHGHTPAPRRGGHQYHSCVARACFSRHDEHLRRNGLGDESQSSGQVRGCRGQRATTALAGRPGADDLLARPLALALMWRPETPLY
jgi:integrase/recombinase XerD